MGGAAGFDASARGPLLTHPPQGQRDHQDGEVVAPPMVIGRNRRHGSADLPVHDPATGDLVGRAPLAGTMDVDEAVAAAREAQSAWAALGAARRAEFLHTLAAAVADRAEELATLFTREQGKPLVEARAEVERVRANLAYAAALVPALRGEMIRSNSESLTFLAHRPVGVVAQILPWNSPLILGAIKLGAALLAGDTVVSLPAPSACLTWLRIGEIAAGLLPPGVLNTLSGPGVVVGEALVRHPDVRMVSFTGGVANGQRVMAASAGMIKKLVLELGGNDPALLLEDVDLSDALLARLQHATFRNAGQVCMAVKRIYVHEGIADRFLDRFVERVRRIRVGPGMDPSSQMGPLHNAAQLERVEALVEDARRRGGTILTGGTRVTTGPCRQGHFYAPTVITGLDDDAPLVQEEQFGPVVPVLTFRDDSEVVARANHSSYGLGASVWTRDLPRGLDLAARLEAGTVWLNAHSAWFLDPAAPFGGVKGSGLGREKGPHGLWEYTELQTVCVPLGEAVGPGGTA